ncbi:hypothetical protein QBC38DRAFT_444909 [Podospora fimiseda]|uniref:Cytoskeleton-associated protein n=1 Tax=Podospora fimiseda TaxID=252190 RepID=A0AAN7BNC4_9PEZI|nr:hypothetical protein QBC38DRAFT_444909 [Podospora fimiseda]
MGWFGQLPILFRQDSLAMTTIIANAIIGGFVMRLVLRAWLEDAKVEPVQPKTQYITQETEDALKLTTLDTLLGHYNYSIRETSAKIVCDRAINDKDTVEQLLWGITHPDYDERIKNLRALAIVTDPQSLEKLHTWKAYAALVRSLEHCLDPDQEVLNPDDWDEYPLRDMAEKLCLMFVSQLVSCFDCEKLVNAKFVEKWLAKQNWGKTDEERQRNFTEYMRRKRNRITEVVDSIKQRDVGRKTLEDAKLIPYHDPGQIEAESTHPYIQRFNIMLPNDLNLDNLHDNDTARALIRSFRENFDEEAFQESYRTLRQRREAMVLGDRSRPLNNDDIIQRELDPTS